MEKLADKERETKRYVNGPDADLYNSIHVEEPDDESVVFVIDSAHRGYAYSGKLIYQGFSDAEDNFSETAARIEELVGDIEIF